MKKIFTLIAAAVMAASVNAQTYKSFSATTVLITSSDNVATAVTEGWAEGGSTAANGKKGSVNPETGEDGGAESYKGDGIMLKKGNTAKALTLYVTGVSSITAYGATSSSSDSRILEVVATPTEGDAVTATATTEPKVSAVTTVNLDASKSYKVEFNGTKVDDAAAGADVALHGVKFVVGTTGINTIESAAAADGKAYNVSGQEVDNSFKGIVVKNGKKYVQK